MMKEIAGKIRKACELYSLIGEGDRIAVGVSGGKDSLALLAGLCELRRYYGKSFTVTALTLDPRFQNLDTDYSAITALCGELGVEHVIKRDNIGEIVFDIRNEKNPCSLCARMRRGALHDMCVERGLNKIALGHHLDDAAETFYMNLFHEGRIAAFAPKCYLSRKDITLIRPLILCTEAEVAAAARKNGLPVAKSRCPMDGYSERQRIKEFIAEKEKEYPGFLMRTFTALQGAHVSGL